MLNAHNFLKCLKQFCIWLVTVHGKAKMITLNFVHLASERVYNCIFCVYIISLWQKECLELSPRPSTFPMLAVFAVFAVCVYGFTGLPVLCGIVSLAAALMQNENRWLNFDNKPNLMLLLPICTFASFSQSARFHRTQNQPIEQIIHDIRIVSARVMCAHALA